MADRALIEAAFAGIPAGELLAFAKEVQAQIALRPDLIERKEGGECVTRADRGLQRRLLDYFSRSALAGRYAVAAEEDLGGGEGCAGGADKAWRLLIDPLDGTQAFCEGRGDWGIMAGLCDARGVLVHSWNLLSSGETFTSFRPGPAPARWSSRLSQRAGLRLDVYDYGAGAAVRIKEVLAQELAVVSLPAAVTAGWGLYKNHLDGLLWLPSRQGKGWYPAYDLVFTGALTAAGWKAALGKIDGRVGMVALAPGDDELKMLWDAGMMMIAPEDAARLRRKDELRIGEG